MNFDITSTFSRYNAHTLLLLISSVLRQTRKNSSILRQKKHLTCKTDYKSDETEMRLHHNTFLNCSTDSFRIYNFLTTSNMFFKTLTKFRAYNNTASKKYNKTVWLKNRLRIWKYAVVVQRLKKLNEQIWIQIKIFNLLNFVVAMIQLDAESWISWHWSRHENVPNKI